MDPIEFNSLECRWFSKQALPKVIENIFHGVQTLTRTDAYWTKELFEHPFDRTKGIKLREGGFEIKSLLETTNDSTVPGHIQKWCKVRREIPDAIDMSSHWLEVTKKRQLLRFDLDNPKTPAAVSTLLDEGCNAELTRFGPPFDHYWTFGLEAYGQDQKLDSP